MGNALPFASQCKSKYSNTDNLKGFCAIGKIQKPTWNVIVTRARNSVDRTSDFGSAMQNPRHNPRNATSWATPSGVAHSLLV